MFDLAKLNSRNSTRKPRARKPVDPASLDSKRLYFGYLPEKTDAEKIKSLYAGAAIVELRGK